MTSYVFKYSEKNCIYNIEINQVILYLISRDNVHIFDSLHAFIEYNLTYCILADYPSKYSVFCKYLYDSKKSLKLFCKNE